MTTTKRVSKDHRGESIWMGRNSNGDIPKQPTLKGYLGNPFKIGKIWNAGIYGIKIDRNLSINLFRIYMIKRMKIDNVYRDTIMNLVGKYLKCPGCTLKQECHVDIIIAYLNRFGGW